MSTYSPSLRRGSVISNYTNDSDIASDKTPISGQPKKLRKQINNDEFKQNYFELNLSTSTGVQVLAFQPGSETTPKKRKRTSRRKSVAAAEEDSNNDSPRVETKQKKRKQSIANSVDTPSTEEILFTEEALTALDQSLHHGISCDQELFEIFQTKMEDETPKIETKTIPFRESKLKGRNLACSTTNIQTTSKTPNSSSRNRSTSASHPYILNQTNSNTIRKRSNSCVSVGQLSNSQPSTSTSFIPSNNNTTNPHTSTATCTLSPPERLMAKEMKLNVYLNLRRESENCGNSQNSPMTISSQSAGTPQPQQDMIGGGLSSAMSAPTSAHFQRFDSNNFPTLNNYFLDDNHNTFHWPMDLTQQQSMPISDMVCKQWVNSLFQQENQRSVLSNECTGLDPALFEALFNNIQDSIEQPTVQQAQHQALNGTGAAVASPPVPELSMETLQSMDPSQLQNLIDILERLKESQSPDQNSDFGGVNLQTSSEFLMASEEFQANDDFKFEF
ncbi:predicted protein [Naegleria gruberi]|uniref:Predicted protein n=1 Tax=Naegleria gruberi TaxID=5762 RepID=D2VW28_NAEGR|nr:uncharacterized protein NAEGRDRAFT_81442 [Naegleria gruberi]EFC39006.1 predicted protein [Naegleria gruberi]|eukprot:XP_002671750.1 predicted protein [Naegleria gruberi strain NEG-M]